MRFAPPQASCVSCAGRLHPFATVADRGYDLRYDLCARCGLVVMNPQPEPIDLAAYYAEGYRREHDGSDEPTAQGLAWQAGRARHLSGLVPRPDRHLDVGASSGTLLKAIGAADAVGVEPGEAHRQAAVEAGFEVHPSLDDVEGTFDLVTMSHVLEHVVDPCRFLTAVRDRCDGRVLIEVPNLYGSKAYGLAHLMAFTRRSLTVLLHRTGFEVERVKLHDVPKGGIGGPRYLTVIAVPSTPRPDTWTPSKTVLRARRTVGYGPQRAEVVLRRQGRRIRRRLRDALPAGRTTG